MSKLINADKLEPDTEWSDYYDGFVSFSQSQINEAEEVKAIPVERVEQAIEEIANKYDDLANAWCERDEGKNEAILDVLGILDKLIEEVDDESKEEKDMAKEKVIAEIDEQEKWLAQAGYNAYNVGIAFNSIRLVLSESEDEGCKNERVDK